MSGNTGLDYIADQLGQLLGNRSSDVDVSAANNQPSKLVSIIHSLQAQNREFKEFAVETVSKCESELSAYKSRSVKLEAELEAKTTELTQLGEKNQRLDARHSKYKFAVPDLADLCAKHPLMGLAALNYQAFIQERNSDINRNLAFQESATNDGGEQLYYYHIDKGYSTRSDEFIESSATWGQNTYARLNLLSLYSQAFVSCGVALVETLHGVYTERLETLGEDHAAIASLTKEFMKAGEVWRRQASDFDGNKNRLVLAVFNQLVGAANNHPKMMWNRRKDGSLGRFPEGLHKSFKQGGKFKELIPSTKLTAFIHAYGPGTKSYQDAIDAELFDFASLAVTHTHTTSNKEDDNAKAYYNNRSLYWEESQRITSY